MKNSDLGFTICQFAEYLWPISTYYDHLGKKHSLRKCLYLGALGMINADDYSVILSPSPEYKTIFIDPYFKAIVVECFNSTNKAFWKLFDLSGTPLFADTNLQSSDEAKQKLVEYQKSWDK